MQSLRITRSTGPVAAAAAGPIPRKRGAASLVKVDILSADRKRQRIALRSIPLARTRQSRGKKVVKLDQPIEVVLWI